MFLFRSHGWSDAQQPFAHPPHDTCHAPSLPSHDLWRIAEPQHEQAINRIAETLVEKVEGGFEVEAKPPRLHVSIYDAIFGQKLKEGEKP
jgi:hypothetical protein